MPPKQGDLSSEARLERATAFRLELVDRIRVRILGAETWAEVAAKRMKEANQQALQALVDWQRMNEANQQALQALQALVGNDGDAKANEGNDASKIQPKKQKTSHDRGTP